MLKIIKLDEATTIKINTGLGDYKKKNNNCLIKFEQPGFSFELAC